MLLAENYKGLGNSLIWQLIVFFMGQFKLFGKVCVLSLCANLSSYHMSVSYVGPCDSLMQEMVHCVMDRPM
jgi:hypothetical protein